MADPNPVSAPKPGTIERVKSGAAILGAIAGAITGLWGVYEKVRTEAKDLTAASYNTLAPQMNQLNDALKQLQLENQQLREVVAQQVGKPRIAAEPPATPGRRPTKRPTAPAGSAGSPPATQPTAEAPAAAAPPAGTPAAPAAQPPAAQPPAEQPAAPPTAEAEQAKDPVTGLLNTVGRTREAIEGLRKVPETFESVLGKKK